AAASSSSQCPSLVARLSFRKFRQCPTQHAAPLPHRLTSELQCVAICSRLRTCNAFHFNISTGQCYHGDACSRLGQWTDGDCNSYKYTDVLCGDCDVAESVFTKLEMKLFYKFSRSGLQNEVNPRRFCLKTQNVTVDARGAHFEGHNDSYLSTETPEFHKLIAYGSEYSAFLRVRHVFDDG
uniref:Apple domain-containing protein n=2 Tax=Macrostomum lignano TaxID=282301 RepID=A0A1I8ILW3_9PLAT